MIRVNAVASPAMLACFIYTARAWQEHMDFRDIAACCFFEYHNCPFMKAASWDTFRTMMNLPNVVGQLCLFGNHGEFLRGRHAGQPDHIYPCPTAFGHEVWTCRITSIENSCNIRIWYAMLLFPLCYVGIVLHLLNRLFQMNFKHRLLTKPRSALARYQSYPVTVIR
jgi:hypothetical protein